MLELEQLLQQHFGYTTFRSGQKEVIEAVLEGRDVIALLPTGMGKSLCYQLPGYILKGPILIISPLLSLMQDQVEQLKRFGEKRVVALNSFLQGIEKQMVLQRLSSYRFIFISPEMLAMPIIQSVFQQLRFSLIVVDEAHCISQWGFDFRPDYLKITEWIPKQQRPPILALSATATKKVVHDMKTYLHMVQPFEYIHSVERANLHYDVVRTQSVDEKFDWIIHHILQSEGPGIIYTQSRKKTVAFAEALTGHHIRAAAYHAGMEALDRQFIQQQFLAGELEWICATTAFGMGIHKENVRQVIHDHIPATIANYMQEVGRAGRDGHDALAILVYSPNDEEYTQYVVTADLPLECHVDLYKEYVKQGENPKKMIDLQQISETGYRVLSYWMEQLSPDKVIQKLDNLRQQKIEQILQVVALVKGEHCLREQLTIYFDQKLEQKPPNCCHYCGIHYDEIIHPRKTIIGQKELPTWVERLHSLLP
ncbi:RecQ family ATP-dependent DNA helicase [Rummeliibacillus suwonensis]|uniref:RecQ family ATP-dependent DNA helicase n=1 Tax=Rummeliibacillus suwonensis TaxID=1306154 RepID=UPI0011B606B5|nr:RecQ family ATP-dependent DNA helicase [Rummeliibacillus suwonensis]MBO2534726.1 ATP-dependent DNA helicase RecQ [Rummeliibacillus suwonensis]